MIKNYFRIAWRNIIINKVSSFINIGGLAVGMAVATLIALWIYDELSFNKYHKNYDRIARVYRQESFQGKVWSGLYTPLAVSPSLRVKFPGDFSHIASSTWTEEHTLAAGERSFNQNGNFMEPDGPEILSLKMLSGSRSLKDLNSILLSETTAKKLFDKNDPINKIIKLDNQVNLKVGGVYKDLPFNSEFKDVSFVSSFDLYLSSRPWMSRENWDNNMIQVLVQLSPGANFETVSNKIRNIKPQIADKNAVTTISEFHLYPMSRWHLYEDMKQNINTGGRIQFVWLFGIIGLFVLLLACINFMNLSTARSEKRAREVGIRKAIGSVRNQLIWQFLTESILIAILAFVLSLVMVGLILPWFNQIANKEIGILWSNPLFWILSIGFSILTGLIAGSYPAIYLSSFNPVKVLKGTFRVGRFASVPRKVLVVIQFTVSVALIIGTIVVYRQVQFTKDRSMGYSSNKLIYLTMKTNDIHDQYQAMKNDLLASGGATSMAESSGPVTKNNSNFGGFDWKGKDPGFLNNFAVDWVNHDYGKTVGWQFVSGRDFSFGNSSDSSAYILNETAVKYMKLENPIGELMHKDGKTYKIIGVIKDIISESPYHPVRPTISSIIQWPGYTVTMRLNPSLSVKEALARVETVFKKYVKSQPFNYKFVDEEYAKKFESEVRIGTLSGFFAILAILISCLGLFGLASFVAEQRTKEIGIRKVLGASVIGLWQLLSKEFVVLVILSCFIAIPVAYYYLNNWLQNYEYRTPVSWWIFALSVGGALLITILTVSFQAIKAAIANPVKSLRSE